MSLSTFTRPSACSSVIERDRLLSLLHGRITNQALAVMIKGDRSRARREVEETCRFLVQSAEFAHLDKVAKSRLVSEVCDHVLGLGPLQELLDDPTITEVMVNAPDKVFFERDGILYKSEASFDSENQVRAVIDRIIAPLGRRIDEQSPLVSARLPQGYRVNAIIPPLALQGAALNIRKFRDRIYTLDELVAMDSLAPEVAQMLSWAVRARKNIAVSGGTGSGKTTLLNALSQHIGAQERVVTIEDSAELKFDDRDNIVRLEARPANAEGAGAVGIRELMINALRMRPDRIVVGECRGSEASDMLQAMTTGHDGSMTTLHANSPDEVVNRLVMMVRYGSELPVDVIEEQIASALDLIVQQNRFPDGHRRVTAITECAREGDTVTLHPLTVWDAKAGVYRGVKQPGWIDALTDLFIATPEEVEQWKTHMGF